MDSKEAGKKNKEKIRDGFYKKRDERIKEDCEFDLEEEEIFQKKNHNFYESNNAEN